jgi:hypothetical protein
MPAAPEPPARPCYSLQAADGLSSIFGEHFLTIRKTDSCWGQSLS